MVVCHYPEFTKFIELLKGVLNLTKQRVSNLIQYNESLATTNKWSNVATIIGISAIVVAVIAAFIILQ